MVFAVYDQDTDQSDLVRIDPTGATGTDYFFGVAGGFTFVAELHQMLVPAGNHVNQLRVAGTTSTVYALEIDRMSFQNDVDPDVYSYFDDIWLDPMQTIRTENPPRRSLSKGYKTMLYTIHRACQHYSARIAKINSTDLFEVMRFTVIWNPDAGA